jgi:glutathione synthase/RimK-type ligase-like ATP-grasp enzyme
MSAEAPPFDQADAADFPPCEIALVTWEDLPDGAADDRPLFEALERRGRQVRFLCWNDETVDWTRVGVAVLRSTWNYHKQPETFLGWLDAAEFQTRLVNSAAVARWNLDKRYLRALASKGVTTTPTVFVDRGDGRSLREICEIRDWNDVVVKPAVSCAAHDTQRFADGAIDDEGDAHLAAITQTRIAMIQPFLPAVNFERERSLMFVAGEYSHAVLRTAFNPGGEHSEDPFDASDAEIDFARETLAAAESILEERLAYARVDLIPSADGPMLMELELVEPSLFLIHRAQAAEDLADLLEGIWRTAPPPPALERGRRSSW